MSHGARYLVAGRRGRWVIWKEGDSRPVLLAKSKVAAIVAARTLARRDSGAFAVFSEEGRMYLERRCRTGQSPK